MNLQINASAPFTPLTTDALYVDKVEVNLVTTYPAAPGDTGMAGGMLGAVAGQPIWVTIPADMASLASVGSPSTAIYACVKQSPVQPDTSGTVFANNTVGWFSAIGSWAIALPPAWPAGTWYLEVFMVSGGVATGITSGYFSL